MNRKQFFKRAATAAAVIAVSPKVLGEAVKPKLKTVATYHYRPAALNKSYVSAIALLKHEQCAHKEHVIYMGQATYDRFTELLEHFGEKEAK